MFIILKHEYEWSVRTSEKAMLMLRISRQKYVSVCSLLQYVSVFISSMFLATVDQRPIPDSEKMSRLKTLLTRKAISAISGMGYSGQLYGAA